MSKTADQIRKTAEATRNRRAVKPAPEATADEAPARRTTPTVRTRRVRRTVDLATNTHRDLSRWADHTAGDLDLTRVTSQDVLSALVDELLAKPELQNAVAERIRLARS